MAKLSSTYNPTLPNTLDSRAYPYMGKYMGKGDQIKQIVLFIAPRKGTVVYVGRQGTVVYAGRQWGVSLGESSDTWAEQNFTPLNKGESVTITGEMKK